MRQGLEQAVHPGKLFSQKQKNDVQDLYQVIPNILLEPFLGKESLFHMADTDLRVQRATFTGINWHNMESVIHGYAFSYVKSLKIVRNKHLYLRLRVHL